MGKVISNWILASTFEMTKEHKTASMGNINPRIIEKLSNTMNMKLNVIYYLYDFSLQVNITWFKCPDCFTNDTGYITQVIAVDLVPFDTVYLSLE